MRRWAAGWLMVAALAWLATPALAQTEGGEGETPPAEEAPAEEAPAEEAVADDADAGEATEGDDADSAADAD